MCNFTQLVKRYWIAIEIALYKYSIIAIIIIISSSSSSSSRLN